MKDIFTYPKAIDKYGPRAAWVLDKTLSVNSVTLLNAVSQFIFISDKFLPLSPFLRLTSNDLQNSYPLKSNVAFHICKGNHKITKCSQNFWDDNQDSHTNTKDNVQFLTQNSKLFDINIPEICFKLMLVTTSSGCCQDHVGDNVNDNLLYGFLVILNFVQVLTISIHQFIVFLRRSNRRTIIHNSKRWSDKKCWQNSNVSFRITRLMFYIRQKTKNVSDLKLVTICGC